MPFPWMAASQSSNAMDIDMSASLPSLGDKLSSASPLRQSFEESSVVSSPTLGCDTRRRILTHQEAQIQPPEDHAQRLERMLQSQSLCDLEETVKRCRMQENFYPEIMAVLERATTRLEVKSVDTESCRRLAGRTGGAYSPRRLASNGLRFSQQGSMLARLDDAAAVDPEGARVQKRLEPISLKLHKKRPSNWQGDLKDPLHGLLVHGARSGWMWKRKRPGTSSTARRGRRGGRRDEGR